MASAPPPPPAPEPADQPGGNPHVLAGFWEKAGAWALPRDRQGEGYGQLARGHFPEIAFCVLFVFASSWGQTFLLAVFQPYWMRELGLSASTMGSLYGGATVASGLLLPWAGRWLDRASPAWTGTVALLGLAAFGAAMAFVVGPVSLAIVLFGLRFFGQGVSSNVGLTNAGRWFTHNRGKAVTLASLGFPLSEALLPISVTLVVAGIGWRSAWLLLAAIAVVVFLPLARWLAARHGAPARTMAVSRATGGRGVILRDWRFYGVIGMMAPLPFVSTGVIFFQSFIAEERGWSPVVVPTGFIIFAVVRALWSLSAGAWVDRLGALRLLPLPTLTFAAGLATLLHPAPFSAYLFFACLGLSFGSSGAIMTATWSELYGVSQLGLIRGLSSAAAVFTTAVAPLIFGLAIDGGVTVDGLLLACGALMLGFACPLSVVLSVRLRRAAPAPPAGP